MHSPLSQHIVGETGAGIQDRGRVAARVEESHRGSASCPGLIYSAAGSPAQSGDICGACRTCGQTGAGMYFDSWVRDTFTDQDKLKPGAIICHACQFCFSERNRQLARRVGKRAPQRMRNYSHFVTGGKWIPLSKGEKPKMRDLLMRGPDLAVIADSGQKHILFRSRPGWWQFEEHPIPPCPAHLEQLLASIESLYSLGFSKAAIESGRYPQHLILKVGYALWRRADQAIVQARETLVFRLALFLAQKDEE